MALETIDQALDDISVLPVDRDMGQDVSNWFAVADEDGVIAFFADEIHAFFFRLALINARMNPMSKRYEK